MDNIIKQLYRFKKFLIKVGGSKERFTSIKDPVTNKIHSASFRYFIKEEDGKEKEVSLREFEIDLQKAIKEANQYLSSILRSWVYRDAIKSFEDKKTDGLFFTKKADKIITNYIEKDKDKSAISPDAGEIPILKKKLSFQLAEIITKQTSKEVDPKKDPFILAVIDFLEEHNQLVHALNDQNFLKLVMYKAHLNNYLEVKDKAKTIRDSSELVEDPSKKQELEKELNQTKKLMGLLKNQILTFASSVEYGDETLKFKLEKDFREETRRDLTEIVNFPGIAKKYFLDSLAHHKKLAIPVKITVKTKWDYKIDQVEDVDIEIIKPFEEHSNHPEIYDGVIKFPNSSTEHSLSIVLHYDILNSALFDKIIRNQIPSLDKAINIESYSLDTLTLFDLDALGENAKIKNILVKKGTKLERNLPLFEYEYEIKNLDPKTKKEKKEIKTEIYHYLGSSDGEINKVFLRRGTPLNQDIHALQFIKSKVEADNEIKMIENYRKHLIKFFENCITIFSDNESIKKDISKIIDSHDHKHIIEKDLPLISYDQSLISAAAETYPLIASTSRLPDTLTYSKLGLNHTRGSTFTTPSKDYPTLKLSPSIMSKLINQIILGGEYKLGEEPEVNSWHLKDYLKNLLIALHGRPYPESGFIHHLENRSGKSTAAHIGVITPGKYSINSFTSLHPPKHLMDGIVIDDPTKAKVDKSKKALNGVGVHSEAKYYSVKVPFKFEQIFEIEKGKKFSDRGEESQYLRNLDYIIPGDLSDKDRRGAYEMLREFLELNEKSRILGDKFAKKDKLDLLKLKSMVKTKEPRITHFSNEDNELNVHQNFDKLLDKYTDVTKIPASALIKYVLGGVIEGKEYPGDQVNFNIFSIELINYYLQQMGYKEDLKYIGDEVTGVENHIIPLESYHQTSLTEKQRLKYLIAIEQAYDAMQQETSPNAKKLAKEVYEDTLKNFEDALQKVNKNRIMKEYETFLMVLTYKKKFNPNATIKVKARKGGKLELTYDELIEKLREFYQDKEIDEDVKEITKELKKTPSKIKDKKFRQRLDEIVDEVISSVSDDFKDFMETEGLKIDLESLLSEGMDTESEG